MITGKPFQLEIVTPESLAFSGTVEAVKVPGAKAPFQILHNHAPIVSELEIGELVFNDSKDKRTYFAISAGFVQVLNNRVMVVVESAEEGRLIDVERAREAKLRAEQRLKSRENIDSTRAQLAFVRAVNRLRVAESAINDR